MSRGPGVLSAFEGAAAPALSLQLQTRARDELAPTQGIVPMRAPKACTVPPFGSMPQPAHSALISGWARMAPISALSLARIGAGVPASATKTHQKATPIYSRPC